MPTKHLDEARREAIAELEKLLTDEPSIERAVLVDDLFGKVRVVLWGPKDRAEAQTASCASRLASVTERYWTGDVWHAGRGSKSDQLVYDRVWAESRALSPRLRLADRLRNRTAWFAPSGSPPWIAAGEGRTGPPIIVFYSFKGGVGRTTALVSFALQRARNGERVVVIDFDLDAPGVGGILAADKSGTTAQWGVVDYLLERPIGDVDLRDYYHACRRQEVTGSGEVLIVPAGSLEAGRDFLGKLARLDLEPSRGQPTPVDLLLRHVRDELDPKWICIDARAGLSEPAGMLLSGLAHLHVLFGTSSEQSWRGLEVVLERIGASRIQSDQTQLDCVLVHAMVPEDAAAAKIARESFDARALDAFRSLYYAADPDDPDDERFWYLRDSESSDAPHAPAPVSYQPKLAHYASIDDIADHLAGSPELAALAERISIRFTAEEA